MAIADLLVTLQRRVGESILLFLDYFFYAPTLLICFFTRLDKIIRSLQQA